ncbi:MAG: hypothetical protein HKN16_01700, partial [Saprospiraceae bacterium]|nr:hypothetical protein [Saprospiraceae bacterium]
MRNGLLYLITLIFPVLLQAQTPTGVSAEGFRTTVFLQWDEYQGFDAVGVNIYRTQQSQNYGAPSRQVGNYPNYTDYNLQPNTIYYYKVSFFDGAGNESPLSNEVLVSTNNLDYLKVANLDLLIPIYLGSMTPTGPQEFM